MADFPPKKNVAFTFEIPGLVSQADPTALRVNPTLASGDVKVTLDGATPTNITTLPTVISASHPEVSIALSQSEMNHDRIVVRFKDAAGAEWCDLGIIILTAARQLSDLAYPATSGRSMVVDASGLVDANVVKVGPTGSGTAQTARDLGGGRVQKNTALSAFEFYMIDATDLHSPKTGLTVTAQRSIDGGAFGACTNAPAEVSAGVYKIDLSAADLNGNVVTLKFTATGAEATVITIVTQP